MLTAIWTTADRWKGRIFFAFVDQGSASAANFLLTILYASWLPLDDFGRYVLVWTVSVLVEAFQVALIMDSMPAIVSRYGQRNRRRIDTAGTWVVLIYGGFVSLLILLAAPIAGRWYPDFVIPLVCLAAVNPFQRLYVMSRRLCYIRDRQDAAAIAALAYAFVLLAGAFGLFVFGMLSVSAAVLLWGLANGVGVVATYLAGVTRLRWISPATVAWLAVQLWRSGRWLAGAALGNWIANWGVFPLVAAIAGIEAAGILRALQNLFSPVIQFNAALNLAMLPRVADKVVVIGQHYARSFAIYASIGFTGLVALYAGIVLAGSKTVLSLMYDKPEIVSATALLWPLAIAATLESARQGSAMALLALGRTRIFFTARLAATATFLGATAILGRQFGFEGVLWANVVSHVVATVVFVPEILNIPNVLAAGASNLRRPPSDKRETLPTLST